MARNESIRVMAMFLLLAGPGAVDGHAGDWKHMAQACGHARDELRGKDANGKEVKATGAQKRADIEDCGISFTVSRRSAHKLAALPLRAALGWDSEFRRQLCTRLPKVHLPTRRAERATSRPAGSIL